MTNKVQATRADYDAKRPFCVVHVDASVEGLIARVISRDALFREDRFGVLRLGPFGTIDQIELGEFYQRSYSEFEEVGVFIGYAEDEEALCTAARQYLEAKQAEFKSRLELLHGKLMSAAIVVDTDCSDVG